MGGVGRSLMDHISSNTNRDTDSNTSNITYSDATKDTTSNHYINFVIFIYLSYRIENSYMDTRNMTS